MSASQTLPGTRTETSTQAAPVGTPVAPVPVAPSGVAASGAASAMAHDCDRNTDALIERGARSKREIGIDVARGMALIGMMIVHILPAATEDGSLSTPWLLSVGKASALFAVVAGVGIAFTTGRTRTPSGRKWYAAVASLLVRAALILAVGLWLGGIVGSRAYVILPYYAALFVLVIPFLRLPVKWLIVAAAIAGFAMPTLSYFLRSGAPWDSGAGSLNFTDLLTSPGATLDQLLLTGAYPALPWLAYVLVGLAIGRTRLSLRGVAAGIAAIGIAVALFARLASWYLLDIVGGRSDLADSALDSLSLQTYTDLLEFGSAGTFPTDSPWWLAVLAPHTATTPDLFFTIGIALAVLGVVIMLSRVIGPLLWPFAAAGSMPLSLYATHLIMLRVLPLEDEAHFAVQAVVLFTFALLWRNWFARGPLEAVFAWVTKPISRMILGTAAPKPTGVDAGPLPVSKEPART